jgi:hypothetical protein
MWSCVGPRSSLDDVETRTFFPYRDSNSDLLGRPARSPSLYRLSYPDSQTRSVDNYTLVRYLVSWFSVLTLNLLVYIIWKKGFNSCEVFLVLKTSFSSCSTFTPLDLKRIVGTAVPFLKMASSPLNFVKLSLDISVRPQIVRDATSVIARELRRAQNF